jgi:hypothetical protein
MNKSESQKNRIPIFQNLNLSKCIKMGMVMKPIWKKWWNPVVENLSNE